MESRETSRNYAKERLSHNKTKEDSKEDVSISHSSSDSGMAYMEDSESYTLIVAKPIRQSLRNWLGCEDVMKVSLQMAKDICVKQAPQVESQVLSLEEMPSFRLVVRFHLMIYVLSILWKSDANVDYIVSERSDIPNLYRDVLKIFHLCGQRKGTLARHNVSQDTAELSHVLCGPITTPSDELPPSLTLTELFTTLRRLNPPTMKHYSLEQAMLLPTIQLSMLYESFRDKPESLIETYQNGYTDNLRLSGPAFLGTVKCEFEAQGIWSHLVRGKTAKELKLVVKMRDDTSGNYGLPCGRKLMQGPGQTEREWLQDAARQAAVSHMGW